MEVRVLEANEYDKLKDTPVGEVFTPDNSIVIVVEDANGKVVGRMALLNLIHLEGTWIEEGKRNGLILHKLEEALLAKAKECGLKYIHTYAPTLMHEDLLQRAGWERLPFSVWAKEV